MSDFAKRDNGFDYNIWLTVWQDNEYNVPAKLDPGTIVLDVGAHIGAFSCLVAERGASKVIAFEPDPDNFEILKQNALLYPQIECHCAALWRSDLDGGGKINMYSSVEGNTGGGSCAVSPGGIYTLEPREVKSVALDVVLADVPKVDLMKIDCEGSEWPVIFTSQLLEHKVRRVVGEFHQFLGRAAPFMYVEGFDSGYYVEDLEQYFQSKGFDFGFSRVRDNDILGLFWATRRD